METLATYDDEVHM